MANKTNPEVKTRYTVKIWFNNGKWTKTLLPEIIDSSNDHSNHDMYLQSDAMPKIVSGVLFVEESRIGFSKTHGITLNNCAYHNIQSMSYTIPDNNKLHVPRVE